MFQAIFGGGFNPNKTKTQLRLCVSRIKLLQNKKNLIIRQQRKDIAGLLANGKEDSARIRVEALIQEQGCSIAYEILELYCELLSVRVELMKMNKSLPEDMRESVASVIYAARRCSAQLPELKAVKDQLLAKYGKDYIQRCQSDETCVLEQVNPRVIDSLAIKVPAPKHKLALLSEIALEHNVDWEVITVSPEESESEMPPPPSAAAAVNHPGAADDSSCTKGCCGGGNAQQNTTTTQTGSSNASTPRYPPTNAVAVSGPYPTIEFSDEPDSPVASIAVGVPLHPGDERADEEGSQKIPTPKGKGKIMQVQEEDLTPTAPPQVFTKSAPAPPTTDNDDTCCGGGGEAGGDVPDLPDTPSPLNINVTKKKGDDDEDGGEMDDLSKRLEALKTGAQLPQPPKDM
jgi:hypothetical protein